MKLKIDIYFLFCLLFSIQNKCFIFGVVQKANKSHGQHYGTLKHGSMYNEHNGGTCSEFMLINSLDKCCTERDDDCYMIHFDSRCYCDIFCDREHLQDNSDCCPDAVHICASDVGNKASELGF